MKKYVFLLSLLLIGLAPLKAQSNGWPANYSGVMLQGFSWDSFVDTQWTNLEKQADELSAYFSLIWVPQSGNSNTTYNSMGYMPVYYFDHNSSFGTEQQLRSMINTYKAKGTGIIADVVINHRNNLGVNGSWLDYPAEVYKGTTYQMTSTDVVSDDDGGQTATWANANGYTLSTNADEGEGWSGCRDLDHKSTNVQNIIKVYEDFLLNDLGYAGFRYDMVKGFWASHIRDYNDAANVQYSVGEFWDSNDKISEWISYTEKRSAAFDFQFRYAIRDAINNNDWTRLNNNYLVNQNYNNGDFKQWAVTFVENHDMQDRGTTTGYTPDPITKDTLAANAFLLAMPGTPCVFLPHWKAYKQEIKAMIDARRLAGITNTSAYTTRASNTSNYANAITGTNTTLLVSVGNSLDYPNATNRLYTKILSGHHYAYWLSKTAEVAWIDKASGEYDGEISVNLIAVSSTNDAKIIYTLDGSMPTIGNGTTVENGTTINIDSDCTLTAGLLVNGVITNITSRDYTIKAFSPYTATIYLKDPQWANTYFYAWTSSGTPLMGSWPGTVQSNKTTINGTEWYYHTFNVTSKDYTFNIIFNQGNGQLQTVDIGPLNKDTYYEISSIVNGKYTVNDITDNIPTDIKNTIVDTTDKKQDNSWYTITGTKLPAQPTQKGIYIHQGKKVIL